jgi:hypothetical protein
MCACSALVAHMCTCSIDEVNPEAMMRGANEHVMYIYDQGLKTLLRHIYLYT